MINALLITAAAAALIVAGVALAWVSPAALVIAGLALLVVVAYAALSWPRAVLVAVVLSPILDRYLLAGLVPGDLTGTAHYLSEGLLATAAAAIAFRGWRDGTLLPAFRHPTVALLAAFGALAVLSALVNAVPPVQAAAGIAFTVDAAVLFVAVRIVGFTGRQAVVAVSVVGGLIVAAGLLAILQAVLSPEILGLRVLTGRFGEAYRLASIFGDPNAFGAFVGTAAPFALFGTTRLPTVNGRRLALAVSFLLLLALWLSFSRGAWLALLIGWSLVAALLDLRALRIGLVLIVVTFVVALVMPRDLLGGGQRPDLFGSTVDRFGTIGEGRDLRTLFILNAVPIFADHPLLGVGPGRYGGAVANIFGTPIYAEYGTDALLTDESQRTVDNFWLHLGIESGLLGTAAFAGAIAVAWFPLLAASRRAAGRRRVLLAGMAGAVAVLTIDSGTTMLLEANSIGFVYWFLLGIGTLLVRAPDGPLELAAAQDLPHRAGKDLQVEP